MEPVFFPFYFFIQGEMVNALCRNSGCYGNEPQLVKAGCCSNLNGQVHLVIQGRMLARRSEGALECHTAVLSPVNNRGRPRAPGAAAAARVNSLV